MRGTDALHFLHGSVDGITPACAGNSNCFDQWDNSWKDHPRVCGEQMDKMLVIATQTGSPPRVRGTGPAAQ